MPEQESEPRWEVFYGVGKLMTEAGGPILKPADFERHADWQNYLAGVRAAVL